MSISIHALREEGDHNDSELSKSGLSFLSTPSARRATAATLTLRAQIENFYPRPPRGGRRGAFSHCQHFLPFLSTPSARRATPAHWAGGLLLDISIHALREEGDVQRQLERADWEISIHALREEGDPAQGSEQHGQMHFYPRPPRGGRHAATLTLKAQIAISIHALREEGDPPAHWAGGSIAVYFYPRPPRGGRPHRPPKMPSTHSISIHALREEGDAHTCGRGENRGRYFYPRPPRGGRPF